MPFAQVEILKKSKSVILIGNGYSGGRFLKAIKYIMQQQPGLMHLIGIVDSNAAKLADVPASVRTFTQLHEALDTLSPDVAIVCVNEYQHYTVLDHLSQSGVSLILCEKPFTQSLEQAYAIKKKLWNKRLSMNMIERFSDIVTECRLWLDAHQDMIPKRLEFFWGKHRIRDSRPSMGVCSEVIHPLDLIKILFFKHSFQLQSAFGIVSNLQNSNEEILDSLFLMFTAGDCTIAGNSSFVWPARDRRIVAYLSNGIEINRIVLRFDSPRWDCDSLTISQIDNTTGVVKDIFEFKTKNEDFPGELSQIYKVKKFLESSLLHSDDKQNGNLIADLEEAVSLQELLHQIEKQVVSQHTQFTNTTV